MPSREFGTASAQNLFGGLGGKESACNAGDPGSIPGLGRSPGEGNGNPLQCSCLENPMDRSLAGYSLWGRKKSDMTERLTLLLSFFTSGQCALFLNN